MNQKQKQRTCKECKQKFTPAPNMFCPPTCEKIECRSNYAIKHLNKVAVAKVKANNKAKKEFNASDRQKLTKDAQTAFNTYIRTRDGKKCISCGFESHFDATGNFIVRQFHAGHYKSQGGNSALRFNELNCHSQCSICNNHLSGNLANYRMNLIEKIGEAAVIELETTKNTKRYSIDELKEIISTYKLKTKELTQ